MKWFKYNFLGIVGSIILLIILSIVDEKLSFDNFLIFNNIVLFFICFMYYFDVFMREYLHNHRFFRNTGLRREIIILKEILNFIRRWDVILILLLSFLCTIKYQEFLNDDKALTYLTLIFAFYLKFLLLISVLISFTQTSLFGQYNINKNSINSLLTINILVLFFSDIRIVQLYSPFHGLIYNILLNINIINCFWGLTILSATLGFLAFFVLMFLRKWPEFTD